MVAIVLQVFQSVPRNDRKVHYTVAMLSDLRTGYFLGCVICQCNDRLNYAVFERLLTIPCILDWLLCYICDFPIKVYTPYVYIYKIPALVSLELRF